MMRERERERERVIREKRNKKWFLFDVLVNMNSVLISALQHCSFVHFLDKLLKLM